MNFLSLSLFANIPQTVEWNYQVAIVMIAANLFAVFIGYFAIKNPKTSSDVPIGKTGLWKNFGLAELLATFSFGHILGAGFILGFANAGML